MCVWSAFDVVVDELTVAVVVVVVVGGGGGGGGGGGEDYAVLVFVELMG